MAGNQNSIEARARAELDDREPYPDRWGDGLLEEPPTSPASAERLSLVERLTERLSGFTDADLENAKAPHPHAFQSEDAGLFPIGEVSVIGAPGREGKTRALFCLVAAFVQSLRPVGMAPAMEGRAVIYSAEDSREQYARLALAHSSRLGTEHRAMVLDRILVPDLMAEGMEAFATLVGVDGHKPIEGLAVDAVIAALTDRMGDPIPPRLLVFETASTLSEAEEDNRAFRVLIRALRKIARMTQTAVVLVHHTSQAAAANLPDLNIATSDIRGGTALVNNARQALMIVNLGSPDDPFPENDARTVLRERAAPHAAGRVTVLVCLDSSKSLPPPPIFFHWNSTAYGPALSLLTVPRDMEGATWRKVLQMVRGERAERRNSAKDEARAESLRLAVRIVHDLVAKGQQPTARAVSVAAGRSSTWAKPYLDAAVDSGDLTARNERVPRVRGSVTVYRPAHSTGGV